MKDKSPTRPHDQEKNKIIFQISKQLDDLSHPDSEPLAREIYEYCDGKTQLIYQILQRLEKDEPWEYISGQKMFHGHPFIVDNSVLIPRPETETLVNRAIGHVVDILSKTHGVETLRIVDTGCGSGCVGLSTLLGVERVLQNSLVYKNTRFDFVDSSEKALNICKKNVENLLDQNQLNIVKLHKSNLLTKLFLRKDETVIFLANLPYLAGSELSQIDPSVSKWEPNEALVGGGKDGLEIIRRFVRSTSLLSNPHKIYLEMDPKQIPILMEEIPTQYTKTEAFHDQYMRKRFLFLEN